MEKNRYNQGIYYRVQYQDTFKEDTYESPVTLKIGRYYRLNNGKQIKVLGKLNFKYTFEDIDTIRVLMEGYDKGTVQSRLAQRMWKAFNSPTPAVRFSSEEREILGYIYYESEMLSDRDKKTLEKVLGIKK